MNENIAVEITAERVRVGDKPQPVGSIVLVSERSARRLVNMRLGRRAVVPATPAEAPSILEKTENENEEAS